MLTYRTYWNQLVRENIAKVGAVITSITTFSGFLLAFAPYVFAAINTDEIARQILIASAVIFFSSLLVLAPYQLYKKRDELGNALEKELKAKIRAYEERSFHVEPESAFINEETGARYLGFAVITNCVGDIEECKIYLSSIEKGEKKIMQNPQFLLPWWPRLMNSSPLCLEQKRPAAFSVIKISRENRIFIESPNMHPFMGCGEHGNYILALNICGKGAITKDVKLKFVWNGNPHEAKLILI